MAINDKHPLPEVSSPNTPTKTTRSRRKHLNARARLWLVIGASLAVLVLVIFGTFWLLNGRIAKPSGTSPKAAQIPQLQGEDLDDKVNSYMLQKKYAPALQLLQAQKPQTTLITELIAKVYGAEGSYDKALAVYNTLKMQNKLTADDAQSAADYAEEANNKALAISYYQQASQLALADRNNPLHNDDAATYQKEAQALEQQP